MSSPLKIDYESIPNQANRIRNTALEITFAMVLLK